MKTKEWTWLVALAALIGLSIYMNRNRFAPEQMAINASLRLPRRGEAAVWPVFFALNDGFKLTSVEVIPFEDGKFNSASRPVWHLISDSNSVPTRAFRYGQPIRGMKPAVKNTQADALEPGVTYRLLLEAGRVKGTVDFSTRPTAQ
ncbi:MAG TPA: hypothetical protein VGO59_07265 [Verrucomicrobiae bacterium]|jgi:hypothetical protein